MTTKTTITLSPIKRSHASPNLTKRRLRSILTARKHQMTTPSTSLVPNCDKHIPSSSKLPDLLNDIHIERQRRETVLHIATMLRKVGDQMDEQLQKNDKLTSGDLQFSRRSMMFVHCLSHVLHFFL